MLPIAARFMLLWALEGRLSERARAVLADLLAIPAAILGLLLFGADWRPCAFYTVGLLAWAAYDLFEPKQVVALAKAA